MANSNLTKQAMATALKELMETEDFEKISVSDICERCHMNRKSFYYHFKDKYDLANWIFDTDFIHLSQQHSLDIMNMSYSYEERWNGLLVVCKYFYENRNFYRKILRVEGQNSFSSYFRDFMYPIMEHRILALVGSAEVPQMVLDFVVDGLMCVIERWLMDKNCITAEEFMGNLKTLVNLMNLGIQKRVEEDPNWIEKIKE